MTITVVNTYPVGTPGGVNGTTITKTLSGSTTGNTLLVGVGLAAGTFTSLQTNLGASGVLDYTSPSGDYFVYRFSSIPSGLTGVTLVGSSASNQELFVQEISGLAIAAPDYTAELANTAGFATTMTYTAVIPAAGDFVFGALKSGANSPTGSTTPILTYSTSHLPSGYFPYYGTFAAAGSQTLSFPISGGGNSPVEIVTYAAAVASTPSNVLFGSSFNTGRGSSFSSLLSF